VRRFKKEDIEAFLEKREEEPSICDNTAYTDVEIGMPLTGRCNLAETPLLRLVGDLQWKHIAEITGVRSKDIIDAEGARLYATFFHVETRFPEPRPMASYGENDSFTVASTLRRFGFSMLEGRHYLLPQSPEGARAETPGSPKAAARSGIPYLRMANSFVKQWQGAGWLKKSRPANPGMKEIKRLVRPPVSYLLFKRAEGVGSFFRVRDGFMPISAEPLRAEYTIVPDRDLNGAGLLYFANYPLVLDICERRLLSGLDDLPFPQDLLDRRTLVHRSSGYFSNASADETLRVRMQGWIENPFVLDLPNPEAAPIHLMLNFRMTRASDQRLMMLSSVKKVIYGKTLGETPLLGELEKMAGRATRDRS
jgi:probable biosynthetic protein (TIGR04098 family)